MSTEGTEALLHWALSTPEGRGTKQHVRECADVHIKPFHHSQLAADQRDEEEREEDISCVPPKHKYPHRTIRKSQEAIVHTKRGQHAPA